MLVVLSSQMKINNKYLIISSFQLLIDSNYFSGYYSIFLSSLSSSLSDYFLEASGFIAADKSFSC